MLAAYLRLFCLIIKITIVRCNIIIALHKIDIGDFMLVPRNIGSFNFSLAFGPWRACRHRDGRCVFLCNGGCLRSSGAVYCGVHISRLFAVTENLGQQFLDVVARWQFAESCHRIGIGEGIMRVHLGPGDDHPVALTFPEGAYLKGLLLKVY